MKRPTVRARALAAGERWVEKQHGKPTVMFTAGRRRVFRTAVQTTAIAAFEAGWLAGWAAQGRKK
jgi:hypothetical protein